jgi:hypothetical protein
VQRLARPSRVSVSAVGVFAGAAAAGAVAFQALGYLNLRVVATILAGVAVAALGWLAQRAKAVSARTQAWKARAADIEGALAVWPLPRVRAASSSLFDTGLFPVAHASASSGADETGLGAKLRDWLLADEIILIVGPAGSGKSSLAMELLREVLPEAWLIAPDGAGGLATLLALDPPFGLVPDASAVLLLDGLERFLPGLRIGPLDDLRSQVKDLHVVATIRDDELGALLKSGTEEGYVTRRFFARARILPAACSPAPGDADDWRLGHGPLISLPGDPAPPARPENPLLPSTPPSVSRDWPVRGLAAMTLALLLWFGAIQLTRGVVNPPPVAAQVAALTHQPDACGTHPVYAPPADAISWDEPVVVVTHDAAGCHRTAQSDLVSVFVPVAGRLSQVYAFKPGKPGGAHYRFSCLGPMRDDPCLTNLTGTSAFAVTGAFTNTATLLSYPIAIERAAGGFRMSALQAPGPTKGRRRAAAELVDGFSSVTVAPTPAFAIVQPFANQPPVYVTAVVSSGSFDLPRTLRASGWSPTMRAGTVFFDRRCKPPGAGNTVRVSFARTSGDFTRDLGRQLGDYWTRLTRPEGASCP